MRRLRRIINAIVSKDPKGQKQILGMTEEEHIRTDEGSTDTYNTQYANFLDCGCDINVGIGGKCFDCKGISCKNCFGHCENCRKPLCSECSEDFESCTNDEKNIRLCKRCYNEAKRKKTRRFLSSFVVKYDK